MELSPSPLFPPTKNSKATELVSHPEGGRQMKSSLAAPYLLCIVFNIFLQAASSSLPNSAPTCGLNFTSHPYEPSGECINGLDDRINDVPTSSCCRNALYTLSQALVWQATTGDGSIFVPENQWRACDATFNDPQQSVSIPSCGFSDLFQGSSRCSSLKLSNFTHDSSYQDALSHCSSFNPSFNDASKSNLSASLAKSCLGILLAATGMILVIMLIKYVTKHKKQEKRHVKAKEVVACPALYTFSKAEIEKAINYGSERKCLGRGSAGVVYKGVLPSGQVVAIKHIHESNTTNSFSREIEGLSRVRHSNLVGLFGYSLSHPCRGLKAVWNHHFRGQLKQSQFEEIPDTMRFVMMSLDKS